MINGFKKLEVIANGYTGHLGEEALLHWCETYQPDVIFEMNRSRVEVPFLPNTIKHIAWIVDTNGRNIDRFSGSDLTYYFWSKWTKENTLDTFNDYLPPGACEDSYLPLKLNQDKDYSFVGHIPKPWTEEELLRNIAEEGELTFTDFLNEFQKKLKNIPFMGLSNCEYISLAEKLFEERSLKLKQDKTILYDIGCRTLRMKNRLETLELFLGIDGELAIYGPDNWMNWDKYSKFYRGFLSNESQMNEVYCSTQFNIHEGVGIHFRLLDCMLSNAIVLLRDAAENNERAFEEGTHFISFDEHNLKDKVDQYKNDEVSLNCIRENAREEVLSKHTWRHRFNKILNDFKQL